MIDSAELETYTNYWNKPSTGQVDQPIRNGDQMRSSNKKPHNKQTTFGRKKKF